MASIRRRHAIASGLVALAIGAVLWTEPASASNVAAGLGENRRLTVPTWLTLLTGTTAVAASALLAALVTDRAFVDGIHEWSRPIAPTGDRRPTEPTAAGAGGHGSTSGADANASVDERARNKIGTGTARGDGTAGAIRVGSLLGSSLGVVALAIVIVVGLEGPAMATANLAVVLAFVGLRALLPMVAVFVVDPWPTIDPFRPIATTVSGIGTRARRAIAGGRGSVPEPTTESAADETEATGAPTSGAVRDGLLEYPSRLASWPAVVGLGLLVWIELVAPVTSDPEVLALAAGGYALVTVGGALLFSPAVWFRRCDPLAVLFRLYGAVAPLQREGGRLRLVVPGARLRDRDVVTDASEAAFVLALVWELTFNGFVVTEPGRRTVEAIVSAGAAPAVAYGLLLWGGLGLAVGCYRLAAHLSRRLAPTYLTEGVLARRFAPSLLAIAAGYHVAHYVAFVVSLAPAALAALASPFAPPVNPTTLALPDWMGVLEIGSLLAGHVLAVWVAHAIAFDCFPSRLQAIRSQVPFVAVMVGYTAISLWLLTLPTAGPVYVAG